MERREELGARIRDAVNEHLNNGSFSDMSLAFFGMDVAAHEGVDPYSADMVRGWMYGTIFPSLNALRAIVAAANVNSTRIGLGWLVYGTDDAKHAIENEDFLRYYRGVGRPMEGEQDESISRGW